MAETLKILMLEDSATDAEIVERLLKKAKLHFEFRLAISKDAFLLALDQFQPDLILADYSLPQFNATEALEIIQRRSLYIPFILVTGTISEEFVAKIIKLGADDYILKDRLARLPAAIEVALEQRQSEKEKLEAQQKLIESENRLRTIFNTDPECIKLLGPEGELLDMNPAGLAIIEAENLQQVKGKSFLGLIKEPYRKAFENLIKNIFKGNSEKLEFGITGLKGTNRWMETHAVPLKDGRGKIISLLSVTRDITEWKKAAEELAEKEFFLRESQRAGNIGSYKTNFVTGTWQSSETLDSIFGINKNYDRSIAGWLEIVHPEDRQMMKDYLQVEVLGKRKSFNKEYRIKRINDKQTNWVCGMGDVKFDDNGNITEMIGTIQDITERKQAEEELTELNQFNKQIIENAQDGIIVYDLNMRYLAWNPFMEKISGIPASQVLGKHAAELFPFLKTSGVIESIKKSLAGEIVTTSDFYFKIPGTELSGWASDTNAPIKNSKGEIIGVIGIVRDITERKKAEELLFQSQQNYKNLLENMNDGFIVDDNSGKVTFVNKRFREIFGFTEADVNELVIEDFVAPDYAEQLRDMHNNRVAGKKVPDVFVFEGVRKDGKKIWLEVRVNQIIKDGIITGTQSVISDITERKKAEEATLKERNLSDSIINSLPGMFYLFDETGKFFRWNKNFETVSGYSAVEMSNLHPLDLFDADVKQLLGNKISEVFTKGMADIEAPFFTKTKEKIPFYFTGWRIIYEGKPCLIGVGIDITERKKAEEKLRESNERYEFVNKATQDTIWEWDYRTHKGKWGEGIITTFGYSEDKLNYGESWLDEYIHPDDKERLVKSIHDRIENKLQNCQNEYRFRCADGSYKFVEDRSFILYDNGGKPSRMIGAMMDITNKVQEDIRIATAIIDAQEQERRFIGSELHDNINQILAGTLLALGMAISKQPDTRQANGFIETAMGYINNAINETRKLSHQLVPTAFDEISLKDIVEKLLMIMNLDNRFTINFQYDEINKAVISDDIQLNLYRILQEQIKNIVKYSEASIIEIAITALGDVVIMRIFDNGKGFNTASVKKGVGLGNIKKRTQSLSGKFILNSAPGKGCEIIVQMPLLARSM